LTSEEEEEKTDRKSPEFGILESDREIKKELKKQPIGKFSAMTFMPVHI